MATLVEDGDPAEVEAYGLLLHYFQRLEALEARADSFEVREGSLLAGDDRATIYDPLSYQLRLLYVFAFDHLLTLRLFVAQHGAPVVGAYPLIRAALELGCTSLWLTSSAKRTVRTFRTLHRVWDMRIKNEPLLDRVAPNRVSTLKDLRLRLDGLLYSVKGQQKSLDREYPSITDIVVDAGRRVRSRQMRPIDVWQACSSLSHGNSSTARAVIEHRDTGPRDAIGSTYMMTSSYRALLDFVAVTHDVLAAALDDRDRLNA